MIVSGIDGEMMPKEELRRHAQKAFENCFEFVLTMPDGVREEWLHKIVAMRDEDMSYIEIRGALTLARATAIRIAAEVAAV